MLTERRTTSTDENSFGMAAQNDVINGDIVIVTVEKITHKHLLV